MGVFFDYRIVSQKARDKRRFMIKRYSLASSTGQLPLTIKSFDTEPEAIEYAKKWKIVITPKGKKKTVMRQRGPLLCF